MQRLIKILQSYFLQSWTLSRPFYINHEIRCLPASYLFRLVINVQKKGTSLQYKIITHNYIHNSSLWQIPSFLFLLSFAFLLASFDFSYLDDIINCWSYGEKIKESLGTKREVYAFVCIYVSTFSKVYTFKMSEIYIWYKACCLKQQKLELKLKCWWAPTFLCIGNPL